MSINIVVDTIRQGNTNVNVLTDKVFFAKHPELNPNISLKREQTTLVKEWNATKALLENLTELTKVDPHFSVPYTGPPGYYVNIINIIVDALRQGNTNVNYLTDKVFFAKHPELNPNISLKREQTTLVKEWNATKALLNGVMPSMKMNPSSSTITISVSVPSHQPSTPVEKPERTGTKEEYSESGFKIWTDSHGVYVSRIGSLDIKGYTRPLALSNHENTML